MKIAIVQSRATGYWNYCPDSAEAFKQMLSFDDADGFDAAQSAIEAAQSDSSIPSGSQFVEYAKGA